MNPSSSLVNADINDDSDNFKFHPTATCAAQPMTMVTIADKAIEEHYMFGRMSMDSSGGDLHNDQDENEADAEFREFLPLMMKLYDVVDKQKDSNRPKEVVSQMIADAANHDKLSTTNDKSLYFSSSLTLPLWHITKVDLPNCDLDRLPNCLPKALPNLKILFLSNNRFSVLPEVIGRCPHLSMVAFKSNGMSEIHPDALQSQLRWLILTDNQLIHLPETIGRCQKLQKLMLSGNALTELPQELAKCHNLELIRLASNRLETAPMHLLQQLPKLSWIGLSDNPFVNKVNYNDHLLVQPSSLLLPILNITQEDEEAGEILGQGAGGVVRKVWLNVDEESDDKENHTDTDSGSGSSSNGGCYVAVKTFSGAMTSDGLADQERLLSCAVSRLGCPAFIQVLGETRHKNGGSLVLEYLDRYQALASPPSLATCSRDVYDKNIVLSQEQALSLISTLLDALVHLHRVGITHGDFYAHNILLSHCQTNVRLTDFGAAYFYDKNAAYGKLLERAELRAFAILVEELLEHHVANEREPQETITSILSEFVEVCRESAEAGDGFEIPLVWWKQKMLQDLARSLESELDL